MDDVRKQIGSRVRQARLANHMTQAQLSEKLHISTSHMSDIENGKINPGLEIFMSLTEVLQVSADWLLQTDIPKVSAILDDEFSLLLSDCTVSEKKIILKMARDIKDGLRSK